MQAEMLGQQRVKADVERIEVGSVAAKRGVFALREVGAEIGKRFVIEAARGLSRDLAFERAPHKQKFAHVLDRDPRNKRSVLRFDAHEVLKGKPADRRG